MVSKSRYTPEQKADALAIYAEDGLAAAVARTGIPKGTISSWAERTGTQTSATQRTAAAAAANRARWEERRVELVHRMGEVAEQALERAQVEVLGGSSRDAKDLATTMAILVDKAQLLTGGATTRAEHAGLREEVIADARSNALRLVG